MVERQKKSKKKTNTRHPKVSILGAGRMGTTIGRALAGLGYQIGVVWTRSVGSERKARAKLPREAGYGHGASLDKLPSAQLDILRHSDLVLVTTPDDAIGAVVDALAEILPSAPARRNSGRVALHFSGALSSEILAPLRENGFAVGSLHPLISISEPGTAPEAFRNAFFAIEGDRQAAYRARAIVRQLRGKFFSITPESKALYHAAAVISSGHLVSLFDIAVEMLTHCGLSRTRAQKVLLPLLESTVTSLEEKDPAQALTGTFARRDAATVRRHLAAIESEKMPDALAAYRVLGKRALELSRRAKSSNQDWQDIADLIEGPTD